MENIRPKLYIQPKVIKTGFKTLDPRLLIVRLVFFQTSTMSKYIDFHLQHSVKFF